MNFNNKNIVFSKKDISKKVILPKNLTPELSEIIGIILGDGHLEHNKKYSSTTMYCIKIAGNLSEDADYHKNEINPMFFKLFNTTFNISQERKNELVSRLYSKAIATFMKELGIKPGCKVYTNKIPNLILNANNKIKISFLRGMFDTDGSISFKKDNKGFHSKPIISISMKSEQITLQIKELLTSLNFNVQTFLNLYKDKKKKYTGNKIELAGKKNLSKFQEIIKFRNPRHTTKIEIYKKYGFCPPYLTYQQKLNILNQKTDPLNFYQSI